MHDTLVSVFPIPPATEPGTWPEMVLYAATVFLEAEGEPEAGKVAVACVIRNRMRERRQSAREVVLGKDRVAYGDGKAFEQFSCWNDDYLVQARRRLAAPDPGQWATCWRAACGAYWELILDPSRGATFYLNPVLTRKIRGGTMPVWYSAHRVTATIGNHEFLAG